jgi:hypothetical protein
MLAEDGIDVGSEPRAVEDWSAREESHGGVGAYEPTLPKRCQLAHGNAVAGDDERLAAVERAHDLAAFVPKLSLADLSRHIPNCSTRATGGPALSQKQKIGAGAARRLDFRPCEDASAAPPQKSRRDVFAGSLVQMTPSPG